MKGRAMPTVPDLQRHALPGIASIVAGRGGLPAVQVATPAASGTVYLHGAHVAAWQPAGFDEVLWLSQKSLWETGKPIRGGVPICFPWFGPRKDGPGHGTARLQAWEIESVRQEPAGVTVCLFLRQDDAARGFWPHDFLLRHRITFGTELIMSLELTNMDAAPLTAEEALHTYFAVGDVRQVRIAGLTGVDYLDKTDGAKTKRQEGDITITAETDRVYLETAGSVTVEDPVQRRRIIISKSNSRDTVVWNPWVAKAKAMLDFGDEEWPGMLCVETCNVGAHGVTLAQGQTHVMTARIAVARL
jgi:glucose-6-phosphate 1-epimerase